MLKDMLTKEELKLFSKKNINKIKREDFAEYIAMYETQLESLKNGYSPEVYKNPIVENIIIELEKFVDDLNDYYYANVLPAHEFGKKLPDEIDREFAHTYEQDLKPIDREITREMKILKSSRDL